MSVAEKVKLKAVDVQKELNELEESYRSQGKYLRALLRVLKNEESLKDGNNTDATEPEPADA